MFGSIFSGLLDILFPPNCILCKTYTGNQPATLLLCGRCADTIEMNRPPFCQKCSRHITCPEEAYCPDCRRSAHAFDRGWGVCLYTPPMRRLLHLFKYGNRTALRRVFGRWIFSFIDTYHIDLTGVDLVLPVPLHNVRIRERGFNQAGILAGMIAKEFSIPVSHKNLIRIRPTENQARLNQKERWTNIHGAFKIKHPSEIIGKSVLIIDDLLTTGATLSEITRILKQCGAQSVTVLTLAIAP